MYNLASLYNTMGDFIKSKKIFFDILKIKSNLTEADRIISQMTTYDKDHSHFINMKNKLSDTSLDEQALMHLHYALGKAYNDQKEYDLSFKNIKKANDLSKKINKYDFQIDIKRFSKIKTKFNSLENIKLDKNNRKF